MKLTLTEAQWNQLCDRVDRARKEGVTVSKPALKAMLADFEAMQGKTDAEFARSESP
jgi:hypothetical protein